MYFLTKSLTTAAIVSALALSSVIPANAMPIQGIALPQAHDVEQVQYRHHRGGDGYYRGHRGYREYHRGYRRHGNYWYPLAAFGAGALIGGALAALASPRYGSSHVQWCSQRYRTYDPSSDTYVPSAGVRARCVSPY